MMSDYRLASQVASKKELGHSNIDRNQNLPDPSSLNMNLAVSGNALETCESERCPHYLLCVNQADVSPPRPEALRSSALCHLLKIENFVKLLLRENFLFENHL